MIKVASQQKMKQINAKSVFQLIRSYKSIPRVQLAKLTKLSRTTISFIVEELIRKELVVEKSIMERSSVGRPAIILQVNDTHKYVIGVELNYSGISGTVFNLNNEPVLQMAQQLRDRDENAEEVLAGMVKVIRQLMDAAEGQFKQLIAISISIPAVLDQERKSIIASSLFKMKNIDLYNRLSQKFGAPIFIENETLLSAMAERELNTNKSSPFIYVSINDGVGASVMLDDWYLEGANKTFLEIGHMSLDIHGAQCPCGNRGCFELHVSILALIQKVKQYMPLYQDSVIHRRIEGDESRIDEWVVLQAAESSDPLALRVIEEIGANLGYGLVNLIHIFNPGMIVIGGRLAALGERLLSQARKQVADRSIHAFSDPCEIVLSAQQGNVSALGASIYAWNKVIDTLME